MSNVTWNGDTANWNTAGDWSGGSVPGSSDAVTVAVGDPEITTNVGTIDSLINSNIVTMETGAALVVATSFTNTNFLTVDLSDSGGASLTVDGTLTNSGVIDFGNENITTATSMTVGAFDNASGGTTGAINVDGGTSVDAVVHVGGAAGFGAAGVVEGTVNLDQNAQIQFASGEITSIAHGGSLDIFNGGDALSNNGTDTNSALTGLTSVAGGFGLDDGASVATGGATATADTLTVGNHLTDSGSVTVDHLTIAPGGTFEITASGSLDLLGSAAGITFDGSAAGTATLQLDATPASGSHFGHALVDFGPHDSLFLSSMTYAAGAAATLSGSTLTVTSDDISRLFTLDSPGATTFQATDDGGHVLVTPVCFCSGTRIRTMQGDILVEALKVGDLAVTASGEARPIVWIGHKRVKQPPVEASPVRVTAGAFGEGRPSRDLWLSPGHAVCVDVVGEVFVPVDQLINGATIAREAVSDVTYWHVELESHDVLLAEGLACESYMDCGNRAFFGREYGRLAEVDPERVAESLTRYARPFADHGPIVEAIRQRLAARAEALGWREAASLTWIAPGAAADSIAPLARIA